MSMMKNVLMANAATAETSNAIIIHYNGISAEQEAKIVRFFKDLAPKNTRAVNLPLFIEKGFPKFEKILGTPKWNKVKKHYGIGFKKVTPLKPIEIDGILKSLRTIENAQFYLDGFAELFEKAANKLTNCPNGMDTITKAKIVRMYAVIFNQTFLFAEDLAPSLDGESVLPLRILKNAASPIFPEHFFKTFELVCTFKDKSLMYDRLVEELMLFDNKLRKEVLSFSELSFDGNILVSSNIAKVYSFTDIRTLKYEIFGEPERIKMDLFFLNTSFKTVDASELYFAYKTLKTHSSLEGLPKEIFEFPVISGSRIEVKSFVDCRVSNLFGVSGISEAGRVIRFVEYCVKQNISLPVEVVFFDTEDSEEAKVKKFEDNKQHLVFDINFADFFAFLKFAKEVGYVTADTDVSSDFSKFFVFRTLDDAIPTLKKYIAGKISANELRYALGIDSKFEEDELGFHRPLNPCEIAKHFAISKGYVSSEEDISDELINNVLVSGNESIWEKYERKELTDAQLIKKLKLDESIASMYFALNKVNGSVIENILLSVKSSRSGNLQKYALTAKLYCYLVENQIKCGTKMRALKGNKRLKISILKELFNIA